MASRFAPRVHDTHNRDLAERFAFVLTFLAGAAGIIFMKMIAVDPYLVAGFAAAMIIGYMVLSMVLGRLQIEPELVGDNCYYLGFLFTLTSLSYTLSQLVGSHGDAIAREELIGRVIAGFGVALSSTIVGVFFRVVLMQIRPDIVARDREMHIELHESVRELRRQLAVSLGIFKQFSVESVQMAGERDRKVQAELETVFSDLSTRIEESAAQNMASIQKMQDAMSAKAVEVLAERAENVLTAPVDRIEQAFSALARSAESLSQRDQAASLALQARFESVGKSLDDLSETFAAFGRRFDSLGREFSTDQIGKAANEMKSALSDGAVIIRAASDDLQSSASKSAAALDQASRNLVEAMAPRRRGFRFFGSSKA